MPEDDLDHLLHITDRTLRGYIVPLRDHRQPLITAERKAKPDMVTNGKRHAQSSPCTLIAYLLEQGWINDEHNAASATYLAWKHAYDCRAGFRGNNDLSEIRGLKHADSHAADRYVKLVREFPRLKLDLVYTACVMPRSPASQAHADMFHLKYTVAFDKLVEVVDSVRALVLED